MKKHFYSEIIELDSLLIELKDVGLNDMEIAHLMSLAEDNLHHLILDMILSELSEEDKKKFLIHLAHDEHDKVWDHLNKKIEDIENKIVKTAEELKTNLKKDIKTAN